MSRMVEHSIVVSRDSEPGTAVIFKCSAVAGSVVDHVLPAVKQAVTKWIKQTDTGGRAWVEASEDFNIGDLAMYLMSLQPFFAEHGMYNASIESVDCVPCWNYDTLLADREVLNRKTYTTIGCWKDSPLEPVSSIVDADSVSRAIETAENKARAEAGCPEAGVFVNLFVFEGTPEILSTWAG